MLTFMQVRSTEHLLLIRLWDTDCATSTTCHFGHVENNYRAITAINAATEADSDVTLSISPT